jgi:hypothetical protein
MNRKPPQKQLATTNAGYQHLPEGPVRTETAHTEKQRTLLPPHVFTILITREIRTVRPYAPNKETRNARLNVERLHERSALYGSFMGYIKLGV